MEEKSKGIKNKEDPTMGDQSIIIHPGTLECQFTFFYNLKARIQSFESPKSNTDDENESIVEGFKKLSVNSSNLSKFYFSDGFPTQIISAHLHGTMGILEENITSIDVKGDTKKFEFPVDPPELPGIDSYAHIECTVYKNGMLALIVRLVNRDKICDADYVQAIKRPEYGREDASSASGEAPGELIQEVWKLTDRIEDKLAKSLNKFVVHGISLKDGLIKPMKFFTEFTGIPSESGLEVSQDSIQCELRRSRPYVGTIIYFGENKTLENNEERLYKFAIACGRTTPEFLDTFVLAREYLEAGTPSRNVYHPGKNIVFIARRGWVCFEVESRAGRPFHLGVVDVVTHAVQAILASARATRWFVTQIVDEGNHADLDLKSALEQKNAGLGFQFWRIFFPLPSEDIIRKFTDFLTRARVVSPFDDLSILLPSHISTHTGIAAVERIRQLTKHQDLIQDARQTITNYGASLDAANQFWAMQNARVVRITMVIAVLAVSLSTYAIFRNLT